MNTASALPAPTANPANITTAGSPADAPWITSDQTDYQPGAPVTLTGGGWNGDNEVKIVIEGTLDNSKAWNLEKTVQVASDGSIELKFNLPEQYIPQYKVTATGVTTGYVAVNTFTDSGGAYTIKASAANPELYEKFTPSQLEAKLTPSQLEAIKEGRADDPLVDAIFGEPKESVQSLAPADMRVGTIVPYEYKITVNGSTSPEGGIIRFDPYWLTMTTSGDNFGFDPNYGVLAAFVDYGDTANKEVGNYAKVDSFKWKVAEKGTSNEQIQSTIQVSGLDNGDTVIVEVWLVLKSVVPPNVTGDVQSNVYSAETGSTGNGDKINVGNQDIPLKQVKDFFNIDAEVSIKKTDNPDPVYLGSTLTYNIAVNNNSSQVAAKGIIVSDTLDKNVTFLGASDGGTFANGIITWPSFDLITGGQKILTVSVAVKSDAPTENYPGTSPDNRGSSFNTGITSPDLLNMVTFTMITPDLDITNNIWYEPTNVLPTTSVTAHKVWIGGPEADHKAVTLTLYRQVGPSGTPEEVTDINPAITPSQDGTTFTYVWTGLPMYDFNFNLYIYTVKELTVPANYNMTTGDNNTIINTYKPALTILKVYGDTTLEGAEFQLYKGNDSGPTDKYLNPVTTGSDGKAAFGNLDDGTYWLAEVKPPKGYKWISDIGPIKVVNGAITGPEAFKLTEDETTCNYIITVPNEPIRELPATGGIGIIPFASGGIGLMIFAALMKKRNK